MQRCSRCGSVALALEMVVVVVLILAFLLAIRFAPKKATYYYPNNPPPEASFSAAKPQPSQYISGKTSGGVTVQTQSRYVIDYTSNGFWPSFVDIRKDGSHTVVFRNVSDSPMRVMGDPVVGSNLPKPSFDQGLSVDRGGEFQMLLSKPGRYYYSNYMNYRHRGVIIVR